MFKNSTELLDHAVREVKEAVDNNAPEVVILLKEHFQNSTSEVQKYCDALEVKTITEILREEFKDYDIKSSVEIEGDLKGIITFEKGPCMLFYPLVWNLILHKK